ncbi:hypothetical protein ACO02O_02060 [Dirofilaria immitis]
MQSLCQKTCNLCDDDNGKEEIVIEQDANEKEPNLEVVDIEEEDEDADNIDYSESETNIDQGDEEEVTDKIPATEDTDEASTIEVTDEVPTTLSSTIIYSVIKKEKQVICTDLSEDCEGKRYLCNEKTYAYLMSKQCPKTCGICQPNHRPDDECRDTASNCNESLCNRQSYQQLMRKICRKTCSLC